MCTSLKRFTLPSLSCVYRYIYSCSTIYSSEMSKYGNNVDHLNNSRINIYQSSNKLTPKRFKSKKSTNRKMDDENSDDSDDEDNVLTGKGAEIKTSSVGSMRADLLLKVGLGIARNKVEVAFYENRIRINSKKIPKKGISVHVGDEIDLIKGQSPSNPNFIVVGRVEILSAKGRDNEAIDIKYRRSKSLVIENYPNGDSWKPSEAQSTS